LGLATRRHLHQGEPVMLKSSKDQLAPSVLMRRGYVLVVYLSITSKRHLVRYADRSKTACGRSMEGVPSSGPDAPYQDHPDAIECKKCRALL
jgi:hypothetical protein